MNKQTKEKQKKEKKKEGRSNKEIFNFLGSSFEFESKAKESEKRQLKISKKRRKKGKPVGAMEVEDGRPLHSSQASNWRILEVSRAKK